MFERFTDRARQVVVLAQDESRALKHNYIGTEHLLLGLIRTEGGVANQVLAGEPFSLTADAIREEVLQLIGQGTEAPSEHIPFTPRTKKVLELSLREALQLGHNYIGTEHILLALIREGEGVAAQVLVKLGVDLNKARKAVIEALNGPQKPAKPREVQDQGLLLSVRVRELRGRQGGTESYQLVPADYDYQLSSIETWVSHGGSVSITFTDGSKIIHNDVEEVVADA